MLCPAVTDARSTAGSPDDEFMLPDLPVERLPDTPDRLMPPELAVEPSVRSPDDLALPDLPNEPPVSAAGQKATGRGAAARGRRQPTAAPAAADLQPATSPTKPAPQTETKQVTRWALSPKFKELQTSFKIPTGQSCVVGCLCRAVGDLQ